MPSTSRLKSSDSLAQWAQKTNQLADQVDTISATSGSIGGAGYTSGQIAAYGTSWINYTPGADLSSAISGGNINFTLTPAAFTNKTAITSVDAANDYLLIYQNSSGLVKKVNPQYIATPGGSTTCVQFNNAGAFGGSTGFTFSAGVLTVPTGLTINTNNLYVAGGKVGIGNVIPIQPLDVTGNIATSTAYYVGGNSVLSATTLGGGVVGSGLTSVGTLSSLSVSGAGVFNSSIQSASLIVTGAATVGTTLGVTGAVTLSSSLGVTGLVTVGTTLGVTGAATLSSTLGVTGAATLSSTLGVTGAVTLSSTLGVTGAATLSSSLGVGTAASGTTGEIRATNNITAYYSSDKRLKENIVPIADALIKLNSLTGVEFDWTQNYMETHGGEDGVFIRKHDVGVIAQQLQTVLPELVIQRNDGYLAVKYDRIVALLIEAIKELEQRVNDLEAK